MRQFATQEHQLEKTKDTKIEKQVNYKNNKQVIEYLQDI